jgi:PKD repeat protein
MRVLLKIILMGVVLASLGFAFSTFLRLTDTCAFFDDSKKVDINLTATNWDSKGSLEELSDFKLPANNEKLSETTFITRKNSNVSASDNNYEGEKFSNNSISENDLISDFSQAGYSTIQLTTNNSTLADGNCTTSPNSLIAPEQNSAVFLVSNFSSNVTNGYAPLSVQFNDTSENTDEWNWDCGDGNTSREQNPIHNFPTMGTYTVNLTVSNTNNTDSKLSAIIVLGKPTIVPPLVANFSSNVSNGFVLISIQFIDLTENATSCYWDFGDGNNSTEQNPVHTYSAAGNYTVKLIATNATCQSTKTREISIKKKNPATSEIPVNKRSSNLFSEWRIYLTNFETYKRYYDLFNILIQNCS